MAAYYTLHIAGLTRELKICPISEKLDIAAFILFSDVELTEACARELAKRVPECDYILTAESKGIPLAYEMSRRRDRGQCGAPCRGRCSRAQRSDIFGTTAIVLQGLRTGQR